MIMSVLNGCSGAGPINSDGMNRDGKKFRSEVPADDAAADGSNPFELIHGGFN